MNSQRIFYNLSCGQIMLGNVTATTVITSAVTASNIYVTGTTYSVNITSTNLTSTNITSTSLNVSNVTATNLLNTNISGSTLNLSTGVTAANINITGNLYKNGVTYGSQWTTTNGNLFYTGGNIGIYTTAPSVALDVSGGVKLTGVLTAGTLVSTLTSSGSIGAPGITVGTLYATNVTSTNISVSGTTSTGTLAAATLMTAGSCGVSGVTVGTLYATTVTSGSIQCSGTVSASTLVASVVSSGSMSSLNMTATNILNTTLSTGTLIATTGVTVGNINFTGTISQNGTTYTATKPWTTTNGNLFYTSGNVGIYTTAPSVALDVSGGVKLTGTISAGTLVGSTVSVASCIHNNITVGNILIVTNGSLYVGNISTGNASLNMRLTGGNYINFLWLNTTVGNMQPISAGSSGLILNGSNMTNQFVLSSKGNIGIGTTAPTGMLTMVGTSGNINGPHTYAYVNSDLTYPVFQQLNWDRDNINLTFDGYYDGGSWRASSSNSVHQINKLSNALNFIYVNGSAGSAIAGNPGITLGSSGNIGINITTPSDGLHVYNGELMLSYNRDNNFVFTPCNGAFGSIEAYTRGNTAKSSIGLQVNGGDVVIGGTTAVGALTVYGYVNSASISISYFNTYTDYSTYVGSIPVTMYSEDRCFCSRINMYSDERIKTNKQNMTTSDALNIIRNIEPKTYNYIDKVSKNNKTQWGFVAQDVESVLSDAVNDITEFIPNVYDTGTIRSLESTGTIRSLESTGTSHEIILDHKSIKQCDLQLNQKIRLYVCREDNDDEKVVETKIVSFTGDMSFMVEEDLCDYNKVFVYGVEVNDFKVLDKNTVFSVATAALKEVDKQVVENKNKINTLQKTNIYKGSVRLENGYAEVNLDNNFSELYKDCMKYFHNNDSFNNVKGTIRNNILTLQCENNQSNDEIDWIIVV